MGQTGPLKLVFMGTPDLAATVLRHVLAWDGGSVAAVYCQPDRPAGRGMALKPPPVKVLALEHGLPVHQPVNFRDPADIAVLAGFQPDYLLVAAYGLLLPQKVLDIPRRYPLNVHTSLLPKYRGAAPIQRAIMNGDSETGVSIMVMDKGMDTGPVVLRQAVPIGPDDTATEMHAVLAALGGKLLINALQGLENGKVTPSPQNHENATYAAKLDKADGAVDFSRTAMEIHALARGVTPWPGAHAVLERPGQPPMVVTNLSGKPARSEDLPLVGKGFADIPPGVILPQLVDNALAVRCADGLYVLTGLQPAGRKRMDAAAFMNGYLKGYDVARFTVPAEAQ